MNFGVEGPTDEEGIIEIRERQKRNFLATLLLSQGVPMLLGGDEIGRTQQRQQQRLRAGQRDQLVPLGMLSVAGEPPDVLLESQNVWILLVAWIARPELLVCHCARRALRAV
jgi:hypothetical protein